MENLEEAPIPNSSETAAAQANDTFGYPNDDPAAIARNLRTELQCPVCDQIPSSLPIPSCPSGHILCKECKKKIVSNGRFGEKPCPVCHSPLGKNNISYLAGTLISFFTDIPCPNKILGCSFLGTLDGIKTHLCQFKMVLCYVCLEDCMRKDFYIHKNMDCFLKDVGNSFNFPTKSCFFLIQGDFAKDEVLVKARFIENLDDEDDESEIAIFGLSSFLTQSSNQNQAKPSKLKIVVENPDDSSFKMEVVTEIEAGPYKSKKIADSDLLLAAMEGKIIHFDLIY